MNQALSGGHQKTLEAGQIILNQGGNAVDAAIAAYLVSFISEPCMGSIGAGGFAIVNDNQKVQVFDFFCQTPKQKKDPNSLEFFPVTVNFGNTTEDFHVGKGSVAVPGAIAGIFKLYEEYGTMSIKDIAEPAILWAKEGIALDTFQSYDLSLLQNIVALAPEMRSTFFGADGTLKQEGDLIKLPQFSDFLEVLSIEGSDLFYKGEIAAQVSKDMESEGLLTRADFEAYSATIKAPLSFDFFDRQIHTVGFPSVGGMILTSALNKFQDEQIDKSSAPYSIEHFQHLVSAFREVQVLQNDPAKIAYYLWEQFGISTNIKQEKGHKWGGTSHFNIIDKDGMSVALTTSIGEGSGYFIPGTDMQMNNMLGEEALMPNGFHNWECDVRLQSMMCPTISTNKNGKTSLILGSGGAGRIPYALAQVLINEAYYHLPLEEAIQNGRIHLSKEAIECEKGFDFDVSLFPNINFWEERSLFFGGVNAISEIGSSWLPVADERRHGSIL